MQGISIGECLAEAAKTLSSAGIDTARLDAEVILSHVLSVTRTELYIRSRNLVPQPEFNKYLSMINRRVHLEPVAYITGEKEFMSLLFNLSQNVLIPRPETEILVEAAIAEKPKYVVDVGTGSGAIAVSIAFYLPESRVFAVDISEQALEAAGGNARLHGVSNRIQFLRGNLLKPIMEMQVSGSLDLITANLPYIPTDEIDKLPPDVREYEPETALDGGKDGLVFYYEMCPDAIILLKPKGQLLLEIGYDQGALMTAYLRNIGFSEIQVLKDLAGLDRVVKAVK